MKKYLIFRTFESLLVCVAGICLLLFSASYYTRSSDTSQSVIFMLFGLGCIVACRIIEKLNKVNATYDVFEQKFLEVRDKENEKQSLF